MGWFDDLATKAGNAWDDAQDTAEQYLSNTWENKKESFLSNEQEKKERDAAIPRAQPSTQQGQGVTASTGKKVNWTAVSAGVGALGIAMKLLK